MVRASLSTISGLDSRYRGRSPDGEIPSMMVGQYRTWLLHHYPSTALCRVSYLLTQQPLWLLPEYSRQQEWWEHMKSVLQPLVSVSVPSGLHCLLQHSDLSGYQCLLDHLEQVTVFINILIPLVLSSPISNPRSASITNFTKRFLLLHHAA